MLLRKLQTLRLRLRAGRALAQAHATTKEALAERAGNNVLIICHGNIYRSAFVGEYLRSLLGSEFQVQSAGFHPVGDRPAPERHVSMSAAAGIDLSSHRSCVVTSEQLAWAHIIVLMDRRNWVNLVRAGAPSSRFVWLGAFAPGPVEIVDPYEVDANTAQAILRRLVVCSDGLIKGLREPRAVSASGQPAP